jgi:hypothetical protein
MVIYRVTNKPLCPVFIWTEVRHTRVTKVKGHSLHLLENMTMYKISLTTKNVTAGRQVGFRGGSNS